MAGSTPPRVLVVVLGYEQRDLTLACLASLKSQTYPRADLLVVDNGSTDGTPQAVRATHPTVAIIETGVNLGYAGGNNIGLRQALAQGHDYVLLLNNDAELAPDCLATLVEGAESDPTIGVAGPTICYFDRRGTIWSAGGSIDWRRGTSEMRGIDSNADGQYQAVATVDFVSGCALLCKRAVLEQVGLLDERFFLYYEDAEWCVRAARAGFRIVHVPAARVWHRIPRDGRASAPYVTYYMARNRLLFLRATGASRLAWLHAVLLQDLRTWLSWSLRPKWRHQRPHRRALSLAWRDFVFERFGRAEAW